MAVNARGCNPSSVYVGQTVELRFDPRPYTIAPGEVVPGTLPRDDEGYKADPFNNVNAYLRFVELTIDRYVFDVWGQVGNLCGIQPGNETGLVP